MSTEQVILNKQLVASVVELINFYSQKGVFKLNEYKDVAEIDSRLKEILSSFESGAPYTELSSQEYGFIVLIFKEGTQRLPTSIDSFGQLFSIYQSFQALLKQALESSGDDEAEETKEST